MFYPLLQPSLSFVHNLLKNSLNTNYSFVGEFNFCQLKMDMFTVTTHVPDTYSRNYLQYLCVIQ